MQVAVRSYQPWQHKPVLIDSKQGWPVPALVSSKTGQNPTVMQRSTGFAWFKNRPGSINRVSMNTGQNVHHHAEKPKTVLLDFTQAWAAAFC